jgi:hypothetical protein
MPTNGTSGVQYFARDTSGNTVAATLGYGCRIASAQQLQAGTLE